jgi:cytochrome c oxidase accessory protein FixG
MATFEGPLLSIKSVSGLAHYTDWIVGHVHGGALGWNGFMAAGMFYYLFPRIYRTKLYSRAAADLHFYVATVGIWLYLTVLLLSFVVAHVFLSYFVSLSALFAMMRDRPLEHPEAFAWAASMTLVMYGNFAWFREQLCLVICPYGRLQSVLTDSDSMVIGYDALRGEPRGKAKDKANGDCVDCGRCVVVCPTGIDIRNGLQMECIGCAACVDACDEVMTKLHRPRGLIRYDSQAGLSRLAKRFWRPRVFVYLGFGVLGLLVATLLTRTRVPFEANLFRLAAQSVRGEHPTRAGSARAGRLARDPGSKPGQNADSAATVRRLCSSCL